MAKEIAFRTPTPWTSEDIKPEKKIRRRLERKWRQTKLHVDFDGFKTQKNKVNAISNSYRVKYYSEVIQKYAKNPMALFKIINRMLHRNVATPLPPHSSDYDLANEFSNFFKEMFQSIQDFLDNPHSGGINSR